MTFGSLFSGIGGLDLGLERAGMSCLWQSEIDPYASRVLNKHWPHVPNLGDITKIDWDTVERPDLVCGGFPCQDISNIGKRKGIEGSRSGLWSEFSKAICHLRPSYVLVENVTGLLVRGLDVVLKSLAQIGYDAEWQSLSATFVGSPQKRARVFIVAYPQCFRRVKSQQIFKRLTTKIVSPQWDNAHIHAGDGVSGRIRLLPRCGIYGMDNGVPGNVDRLRCLGNAVVPQVAELIGKAIVQAHQEN